MAAMLCRVNELSYAPLDERNRYPVFSSSRFLVFSSSSELATPHSSKGVEHMKFQFVLGLLLLHLVSSLSLAGTWRDDFEDNVTQEWEIYNLNRQVEKWWIDDGEAVGQIFERGFMSLWLTGDLNWKNYSITCRTKLVEEKNDDASVGLTLYDRGDEDLRYLFFINFTIGTVSIIKALPNQWFIRNYPFVADINVWYSLKATVNEDLLEFQINDEIFQARDLEPLKSGQAGLVVSNARAHFDDVEITGENIKEGGPGKPRAVDPKRKLATTWGEIKSK
jgi:hypothetical protein